MVELTTLECGFRIECKSDMKQQVCKHIHNEFIMSGKNCLIKFGVINIKLCKPIIYYRDTDFTNLYLVKFC